MVITRRTILKGAAGATAASALALSPKASRTFAAPAIISRQGSNTEVNFWYGFTGNLGDQVQVLIDEFNAQGNGVTVVGTPQASYEETAQQATIAVQDGSNPDIAILSDVWWFRFYLAQLLLPMDDLISSTGFEIDDVVDSFRYEGVRQGVQYWLPFARSTPLVYWNTDIFAAAGVTEFPTTWSAFEEIAPSLVDDSQQIGALALGPAADYLAWPFQGITWAYGGAYSDPDFTIRIDEEGADQRRQSVPPRDAAGLGLHRRSRQRRDRQRLRRDGHVLDGIAPGHHDGGRGQWHQLLHGVPAG